MAVLAVYLVVLEAEEPRELQPLAVAQNTVAVLAVKVGGVRLALMVAALYMAALAAEAVVGRFHLVSVLVLMGVLGDQMLTPLAVVVLLELG